MTIFARWLQIWYVGGRKIQLLESDGKFWIADPLVNLSKSLRTFIAVGSVEGRGRGLESLERETVDHGMVERWIGVMDLGIVEWTRAADDLYLLVETMSHPSALALLNAVCTSFYYTVTVLLSMSLYHWSHRDQRHRQCNKSLIVLVALW